MEHDLELSAIRNLISADVVTADGEAVTASALENESASTASGRRPFPMS
jgi:hypothetical protein